MTSVRRLPVLSRDRCSRGPTHIYRFRVYADPRVSKKADRAPDLKTPQAPPPPPIPPPPPPSSSSPSSKLLGVDRRFMIPLLISLPLSGIWLSTLLADRVQEEVVASVDVPIRTKKGVKNMRRDVKMVMGKNKMAYVMGRDYRGRRYMVDANGILYYDSGMEGIGWFMVKEDGEVTNIFMENGKIKAQLIGNINDLRDYSIDEFMGLPINRSKIKAFPDTDIRALPPNVPLVKSQSGKDLIPPFFVDEGEMTLEENKDVNLNPFRKLNQKFKYESMDNED